ncbi:MAG: sensor histidine kinase, partial [Acidobacteriota bacterium]
QREVSDRRTVVFDVFLITANASALVFWLGFWFERNREHRLLGGALLALLSVQILEGLNLYFWVETLESRLGMVSGELLGLFLYVALPIWAWAMIVSLRYFWSVVGLTEDLRLRALELSVLVTTVIPLVMPSSKLMTQLYASLSFLTLLVALLLWAPAAIRAWRAGRPGIGAIVSGVGFFLLAVLLYDHAAATPIMARWLSRLMVVLCATLLVVAFAARQRQVRQRADALGRLLIRSTEEERQRVARDLHDGVVQRLAAHGLTLRHALRRRDLDGLAGIVDQLADTSSAVRSVVHELGPYGLDRDGLAATLRSYVERIAVEREIEVTVRCASVDRLDRPATEQVFRIVQEAINNAVRHGRAEQIDVDVEADDRGVSITVADDGMGFDRREAPAGLGLAIMAERAAWLGGRFAIERRLGKGTVVSVRPVEP